MRILVVTSNINILFIRLTYPCVSTKKKKLALVIISKNFVFVFVFFNLLNLLQKKKYIYIYIYVDYMQVWLLEAILANSQHFFFFVY